MRADSVVVSERALTQRLIDNGYWIDTTLNACTVTLPGSASVGDQIIFVDYARTWGTNNVTLNSQHFFIYTSNIIHYPLKSPPC